MKKLIKMYNEKYGNTLGVIDDDFNKEQMYRIYYFIKNNCDDKDIQDRIKIINLDKPKTLEQQLTKLEGEHNVVDPTIKSDINNIKDDLGDEELTTTNKDVKGAINEVNAQCKETTSQLDSIVKEHESILSILNFGGNNDGITVNDTAFQEAQAAAQGRKVIHFPQNPGRNACYYVNSYNIAGIIQNPLMRISCDYGVKISVPSMTGKTFKCKLEGENAITFIVRDRNHEFSISPNVVSKYQETMLGIDDINMGVRKLKYYDNTNLTSKGYYLSNTDSDSSGAIWDSNYKMFKCPTSNTTDINRFYVAEKDIEIGKIYYALFNPEISKTETNENVRCGFILAKDGNNLVACTTDINSKTYIDKKVNGINDSVVTTNNLPDSYSIKNASILSIFIESKHKFRLYINGALTNEINLEFDVERIGIGVNNINSSGSGVNNFLFGNFMSGDSDYSIFSKPLNVVAFGDSITEAEANVTWLETMKHMLTSVAGIQSVNITNYAISGQTSTQQLAKMKTVDLTNNDVCLILIGTNDIQQGYTESATESNIQQMIDLAKNAGLKVVIGTPPMFYTSTLSNSGFDTKNYEKGAIIRSSILKLSAINDIEIADIMSEFGTINADTYNIVLRDNLHPTEYGFGLIAKCFAKSILYSLIGKSKGGIIENSPNVQEEFTVTFADNVSNLGGEYQPITGVKKGNIVSIIGVIKVNSEFTNGSLLLTIPKIYAPGKKLMLQCGTNKSDAIVEVRTNGEIVGSARFADSSWIGVSLQYSI